MLGAIYGGRDWSMRGHIIRYNFFHHLAAPYRQGAKAIYLDDGFCGVTVFGNIFYKSSYAVFIGGGRDNVVQNNMFIDCRPCIYVDARGRSWMSDAATVDGVLQKKLKEVPFDQPPYSNRYPGLADILKDEPSLPKGNIVTHNVSFGGRWLNMEDAAKPHVTIKDNLFPKSNPGFVNAQAMNFTLKDDSILFSTLPEFKKIPFERMGLYGDDFRKILPK